MLPSWTFALAWLTLFKNRTTGRLPGWMETFGFTPPDWLAYGALPISLILALHYAPFVILLFGNALEAVRYPAGEFRPQPRRAPSMWRAGSSCR